VFYFMLFEYGIETIFSFGFDVFLHCDNVFFVVVVFFKVLESFFVAFDKESVPPLFEEGAAV